MFCPKCATQNLDGASYCRSCGANIILIPQALSGQMPQAVPDDIDLNSREGRRRGWRGLSLDHGVQDCIYGYRFPARGDRARIFGMGGGGGSGMLIPAFSMMGTGVAQFIRLQEREKQAFPMGRIWSSLHSKLHRSMPLSPLAKLASLCRRRQALLKAPLAILAPKRLPDTLTLRTRRRNKRLLKSEKSAQAMLGSHR